MISRHEGHWRHLRQQNWQAARTQLPRPSCLPSASSTDAQGRITFFLSFFPACQVHKDVKAQQSIACHLATFW